MTNAPQFPRDYKPKPRRRGRTGLRRTPRQGAQLGAGNNARRDLRERLRRKGRQTTRVTAVLWQKLLERIAGTVQFARRRLHPLRGRPVRWLLPVGAALVLLPLLSWTFDAVAGWRQEEPQRVTLLTQPLPLPSSPEPEPAPKLAADTPVPNSAAAVDDTHDWQIQTVRSGDSLAAVFKRMGLGPRDVHQVVNINDDTRRLTRIYPGDELHFSINPDGALRALEYQLDETRRLRVTRNADTLTSELITAELFAQVETAEGQIDGSFFMAGREAGLSDKMIMELAGLFGWDIDFVLDIRSGDRFYVLYEQLYRDGDYLRPGQIIAATFVNQGQKFQAVRFETENGTEYFSPDGRNMRKAFLRAPLNFSYISSNFNPKRFHPILQRVKAHRGTDYRAPSGTPVFAAGHGKVIASAKSRYNGNYVYIQHGNNIVTRYLHFSRRAVKKGQRVKQGQVIGYVGATGLAEAPHLHYEFLVNGVHRNPRTVDLPKADPLPAGQLAEFQRVASPLLRQLESLQGRELLALGE